MDHSRSTPINVGTTVFTLRHSMRHVERYFTASDSTRLYSQTWLPAGSPRAFLVIIHGIAEHGNRYKHVAEYLSARGIGVGIFDLRGHGRSGGRRAYVHKFAQYPEDVAAYIKSIRTDHENIPLFLMGQSMGGTIAALYTVDAQNSVDGLILTSPALKLRDNIAPFLQRISGLIGRFMPVLPTVRIDPSGLSRDPEVVADYAGDPLVYHGRTLARTGAEFVAAIKEAQATAARITLPVLLIHGSDDTLCDPEGSLLFYELSRSPNKTLKLYQGLYHETLNEPEKNRVLSGLFDWLEAEIGDGPG